MRKYLFIVVCFFLTNAIFSQEQLMDSIILKNYSTFNIEAEKESFKGQGWHALVTEMSKANSVLIGETHFTNEVPYFVNAVIDAVKFDIYFQEIDPYSNGIIENKIKTLSQKKLEQFIKEYSSTFSFLERKKDFYLYKKIIEKGIRTYGLEQVYLDADRLIISYLKEQTKNKETAKVLSHMLDTSNKLALEEDTYLFSEDFIEKSNLLLNTKLSSKEQEHLEAIKLSREIYLGGKHHLRIQVMKHQLLEALPHWSSKKNLFKFGAVHTPKGESLMEIYDIGNLVFNIEDANFRTSLHIILIGKTAAETMDDLKLYSSFLGVVTTNDWYCFDLKPLQKAISQGKLKIGDQTLLRIVKGNDFLIYIPELTESEKFL
ncbi:hypothetical protein [Myroides odoratimimus]|uniref:hypothetical protein n=1 Tax=Myroides odoratimimus TaxID=76832 RepID=UPI0009173E1D|nr:hypothetical protein [Myroides odoratimimus]SHL64961.1 hypothetical protein SAMN05444275_105263 [Myroides odoratimimus subsp. xuanwuensis]